MDYKPDPEKQIHQVGLVKAGDRAYHCQEPALLVEWLQGKGLVEVKRVSGDELGRLAGSHFAIVSIGKSGSVRVSGSQAEKVEQLLQGLLRE